MLDHVPGSFRITRHVRPKLSCRACIDNNAAERSICLGRKKWLFAGSDSGGERAAAAYSLIESAKLNGFDPEDDLRQVLTQIVDHPVKRVDELVLWNMTTIRARLDQRYAAWASERADLIRRSDVRSQPPGREKSFVPLRNDTKGSSRRGGGGAPWTSVIRL